MIDRTCMRFFQVATVACGLVLAGSGVAAAVLWQGAPPPPGGGGGSTGGTYDPGSGGTGGSGSGSGAVGGTAIRGSSPALGDSCCDKTDDTISHWPPGTLKESAEKGKFCIGLDPYPDDSSSGSGNSCSTCDSTGSAVGDWALPNAGGGCGICGGGGTPASGGSGASSYVDFWLLRRFHPNNQAAWSSLGPGMFLPYDAKIYLFDDGLGSLEATYFEPLDGRVWTLVDGLNGDTQDGMFADQQNMAIKSLELLDGSGASVSSLSAAAAAEMTSWTGLKQKFGVLNLSSDPANPEYVARLESVTDRNGHTLSVTYRDSLAAGSGGFTAQELTDSPERRWQIYQVTDWQGDVATFNYKATQESSRWVLESIDLPDATDVDYTYTDGRLSAVTFENGSQAIYAYGQDTNTQTATVTITEPAASPTLVHLTNDYMTLGQGDTQEVVNQPQGVVRMIVSDADEITYMLLPDPNDAGKFQVYEGTGSAAEFIPGQMVRHYEDNWQVPDESMLTSTTIALGDLEPTYTAAQNATASDIYRGTIPGEIDHTGREFSYQYDADTFLTRKTFDADGTYEDYSYNQFKQVTRVRDRQGNVQLREYDANGNLTKVKIGLIESGGQDVAQPEYAERTWDYYPVGHVNAGLLKTEYAATWDGSSTDTHRTDYEYDARGNVTKRLKSASVTGGDRPETTWVYDADDRVISTTDPEGHTVSYVYDDMDRVIRTTFDDGTTSETLYGTAANNQVHLVLKEKSRRGVVTAYTYDDAGRLTQSVQGAAWDSDILDGQPDDTPITDRNEQAITTYTYMDGTENPISISRDGAITDIVYDYRQRSIETKVYPYANKMLVTKKTYVENNLFSEEDPYGRMKYYGYRASDGQLIRHVTGAYPSFTLTDQAAVFALQRDTNLNPDYVIKDAITDENGRPEQVIDERGVLHTTEYDASGNVIRKVAAAGTAVEAITEMDYDDDGNLLEIREPRYFDSTDTNGYQKCRTVMTYDGEGRVLTRTEAPGTPEAGTQSFEYDSSGRQTVRTDELGNDWVTAYASCCGHSISSINPLGHGSITNQNANGLVVHTAGIADVISHASVLNPDDTKTLQEKTTLYDALGRPVASCTWLVPQGLIDPEAPPIAGFNGIAGTDGLTSQTLYDADLTDGIGLDSPGGITVTNPLGGTFTISLAAALTKLAEPTAQGGADTTFGPGSSGSAVVNLNAENEASFSISDAAGRSVISGAMETGSAGNLLSWSCSVHDTIETVTNDAFLTGVNVDALGNTASARINGLGHILQSVDQAGKVSAVQYDPAGNAVVTRDPNNVGRDCVYDELGQIISCTDTVGSVAQTGYNRAGNSISSTDAKGKSTLYAYDARGRRRVKTNRLTFSSEWTYDAAGNLLSHKDAENQITKYTYDDAGQRLTAEHPDHVNGATIGQAGYGVITFTYDAAGRRLSKEDQQGDIISYNFDIAGRMLTRVYTGHASGPLAGQVDTDTFTYDRASRMLTGVKGRYNNTITLTYDDQGRQTQETLTTHGATYTVDSTRNALGQIVQLAHPDGSQVDRTYTNRGQLQSVTYTPAGGTAQSVATFTYDDGGRETQRALGNGLTTTRSYFADNQIQSIATPGLESLMYTYDANKNPTSETRTGVMSTYSWSIPTSGFDDEDRLVAWNRANGDSQTWSLSPVSNWSTTSSNGATQTRVYGPAHEIQTMSGTGLPGGAATLQHDSKGNMTVDPRGSEMGWDFENQLQTASVVDNTELVTITYEYDALGRLAVRTTADAMTTTTTVAVHFGRKRLTQHQIIGPNPGFRAAIYSHGESPTLSVGSGADYAFALEDANQSIIAYADLSGEAIAQCAYSPYGEVTVALATGHTHQSGRVYMAGNSYDEVLKGYFHQGKSLLCNTVMSSVGALTRHRKFHSSYMVAPFSIQQRSTGCKIQLVCTNLGLGFRHCGLELKDSRGTLRLHVKSPWAGVLDLDTCNVTHGRITTPIGVGPWLVDDAWTDPTGSVCDCIRKTASLIRKMKLLYRPVPSNLTLRIRGGNSGCRVRPTCNSNYTTRCLMNKCGLLSGIPTSQDTPGWDYRRRTCKKWIWMAGYCTERISVPCKCEVWSSPTDNQWCGSKGGGPNLPVDPTPPGGHVAW